VAQVAAQETGDARFTGELGHVGVEVHPVDAFQFQDDMFALELGDGGGSVMAAPVGRLCSFYRSHRRLTAKKSGTSVPRCPTGALGSHPSERGRSFL
jgi:hypothetical protein